MKEPEVGELWLDVPAYAKTGKPRLLVVTSLDDETVHATAIEGGQPGPNGVPRRYFAEGMLWQGYWSVKHERLPRLEPPYEGHIISDIPASKNAAKLHGSADLVNSIIPSWAPSGAQLFNADRKPVEGAKLERPVSSLPAGVPYLQLRLSRSFLADSMKRPAGVEELWYQKQGNAWYLVRTLAYRIKS